MKTLLAAFVVMSLFASGGTAAEPDRPLLGTRLELQARGEVRVVPDLVLIRAGVVTHAAEAATAMRDNAAHLAKVRTALRQSGIADRDIQTAAINLAPQYRYPQNEAPVLTGYHATNTLSVRFRDVARSGSVLDALVRQGVNQIDGPHFMVEDRDGAEDRARVAAIKALETRAALYAMAMGKEVRRVVSVSEAAESAAPIPYSMARSAASADAKAEVMPGEQDIIVSVSAVFELD